MSEEFDINNLDKVFESRIRLGVMSVLSVNDYADFNTLKSLLKVTDGNLASHISALEKCNFILVNKEFVGKKPRTTYKITEEGRLAFERHLSFLEKLIQLNK
ncbi:MAG TPA: transcriptional regulator [Bacteroidales bacterium]|jgi:DNA-binding MarR family transcriptional regulator|nr:transcriptional regulator [Bacteroidales bacterium]HNZ43114.1 transcriptional regulator [Bacteroidales bacterium]HOH83207.1 transcriptional regulator [Bacteroidales bacterium]HPB25928.1 transcriptional regulator [Bacteroidales bacterium]HPI29133.1 transcriptional regulator [Bacteroidales bacterium]